MSEQRGETPVAMGLGNKSLLASAWNGATAGRIALSPSRLGGRVEPRVREVTKIEDPEGVQMDWAQTFKIANTAALLGWIVLIALPRYEVLRTLLQRLLISAFCLFYTIVVMLFFFRVEGGGFNSLAQVKSLFTSDAIVCAGWVHYLAFDLFVGLWIAKRADSMGMHRLLQAPILLLTFLFGPIGLGLFYLIEGGMKLASKPIASENVGA